MKATFCFRQATQAVIFLLISGGLQSPNVSRSAAIWSSIMYKVNNCQIIKYGDE